MSTVYEKVMQARKEFAQEILDNITASGYVLNLQNAELINISPRNPVTMQSYHGVNRLKLMNEYLKRGYTDGRWLTFDQIKEKGYHLKKGSAGVLCEKWIYYQTKKSVNAETGEAELTREPLTKPRAGYFYLFNAEDIEGIEQMKSSQEPEKVSEKDVDELLETDYSEQASELERELLGLFLKAEEGVLQSERRELTEQNLSVTELIKACRRAEEQITSALEKLHQEKQTEQTEEIQEEKTEKVTEMQAEEGQLEEETKNEKGIQDFGEKIGGARKDVWKSRNLLLSDLEMMNEAERRKYITKDAVWKKPDYEVLMAEGIPAKVVWYMKKVRDSLPVKPILHTFDISPKDVQEREERYILFVSALRDRVMECRTTNDICSITHDFLEKEEYVRKQNYLVEPTKKAAECINNKSYRAINVTASDLSYKYPREMEKAQFGVPKEDKLPRGYRIIYYNVAECYGVLQGGRLLKAGFETGQLAKEWLMENVQKAKERRKAFISPQLESVHRHEMKDIRENREITGQDYLDSFHFRGGEFGNWMSQVDRQGSLNMGYEALYDLADALSIPCEDISLGGELAIAFGARGHGKAAAHYEPLQNVINLTKMKGAGSLAHEWGHALDAYIGNKSGRQGVLATNDMNSLKAADNELYQSLFNVLKTMSWKEVLDGTKSKTDFYRNSEKMDDCYAKEDKGYWSSWCEMFARAFACYVLDKIKPGQSDYLCGHAECALSVDTDGNVFKAFPEGEERAAINKAIDNLMDTLKEKELLHNKEKEQSKVISPAMKRKQHSR